MRTMLSNMSKLWQLSSVLIKRSDVSWIAADINDVQVFLCRPSRTARVSLFASSCVQKKYEKKQISVCECQDSECTLLKCYLGFGNWGLGGLFGQKDRREVSKKKAERKKKTLADIYAKASASAAHEPQTLSRSCALIRLQIVIL